MPPKSTTTITRKPQVPPTVIAQQPSEADIRRVIHKGGSVAQSETSSATAVVNLRTPIEVLARIDRAVAARQPKTSRHYWLLEAVLEKLEREEF